MSYHPSGPEGLRLLARFFEEVLNDHACFDLTPDEDEVTVEEDLRRWADEMEEANDEITTLRAAVASKNRLIVHQAEALDEARQGALGLCQAKPDHGGPHAVRPECLYWMQLAEESN